MKNYILPILLACFSLLSAQTAHKINWGFHVALTHSLWQFPKTDYVKTNALYATSGDTLLNVTGKNKPGIQIGFSMAYNLSEKWKIRIMPCLDLTEPDFKLTFTNRYEQYHYASANFSLPIQVVWQMSQKAKNPYLFLGINPKSNGAYNEGVNFYLSRFKRTDVSVDFGVGYGRFGKTFPISPELRFSLGLNNLIEKELYLSYLPTSAFKYHSIALICHLY